MKRVLVIGAALFALAACGTASKTGSAAATGPSRSTSTRSSATTARPKTTAAPDTTAAAPNRTTAVASGSRPAGVDQATWDDYSGHGAALAGYLRQGSKGTITNDELVSKLNGSQDGIQTDADITSDPAAKAKFQDMTDAIGRVKVAISNGDTPDVQAIVDAATALGTC